MPGATKSCFHGGAFFEAIGEEFDRLDRADTIVNADVLDAWFPPAPGVIDTLREYMPWLLRTSPPTNSGGLRRVIANRRQVSTDCVLPGAGSSDLIYLALTRWLTRDSRVLLLDPTYGEYAHVLERVIGCAVTRFSLARSADYQPDLAKLREVTRQGFDLVVIVNPNSPTGAHIEGEALEDWIGEIEARTRVWIDETYIDYVGGDQSLERFATRSQNTVVCKSMSKVYALSGVRAAYLCGAPGQIDGLRRLAPPWSVSLPAQVAAVRALDDPDYYARRYRETHALRRRLKCDLEALPGVTTTPSVANFILCHLAEDAPTAEWVVSRCRRAGVFLRDASNMGVSLDERALRVAVKNSADNARVVSALSEALSGERGESRPYGPPHGARSSPPPTHPPVIGSEFTLVMKDEQQ